MELEVLTRAAQHQLRLTGELDLASAPALEAAIARLCRDGASEIVLDLSQLTFIDSTGVRTILQGKAVCEGCLCDFSLIPGRRSIQRVFEVTGVVDVLSFVPPTGEMTVAS
jgi:anti-sigma B factor antagonist